ncbi:MAG: type II secretion system inner membrane protein GspF [Deltaproteobacteria bacterium]|nr:type II secretion system inner membrane protein GspF [Deltaproteobacteria bacterium]
MGVFAYKGINRSGKSVSGTIDAENLKSARSKLRKLDIFPTTLNAGEASSSLRHTAISQYFQRVSVAEIANMTRQLSTLIGANVPLVDSLAALVEQIENPKLRNALSGIKEKVVEGAKLSDSMRAYPKFFGDLYISMISAGEASGALDLVLKRLADFTEAQAHLKSKVIGAVTYPVVMAVVAIGLMFFLMVGVVPKIVKIFTTNKVALPTITNLLVKFSTFLQSYWWLALLLLAILIFVALKYKAKPKGKYQFDKLSLKLPIFGELFKMIALSRFSRTLSTLLSSGVPLVKALDIVKNVVANAVLTEVIENTKVAVKEGEPIASSLGKSEYFPPLVVRMIAIGEKTGQLEPMLERVADAYDTQVETRVSTLTTLLEPLIILTMGGIVAFIVLSILLPILKLNQLTRRK